MTSKKTDSFIEYTCLVSFLITIVAYKDHASWIKQVHNHTLFWDLSDYLARGILIASLSIAVLGGVITLVRVIKFFVKKPKWDVSIKRFRKYLKEPYEPTPWLNAAYSCLGFLIFPLPFVYLLLGMLLATLFSVTIRHLVTLTYFQNSLGLSK